MTTATELISQIYQEMGLATPKVIEYPSITEAIERFIEWKPLIRKFSAVMWDYQYPVLHPESYWAQFHLFDEGFQFDLTRTANRQRCYCYPRYHSKIPIKSNLLFGRYLSAVIDATRNNGINEYDHAISGLMDTHEQFFDELINLQNEEDPTSQAPVESCVFLSPQSWLHVEFEILRSMREWVKKPLCEEHYQNVKLLRDHDCLFMTFGNLVVSTKLTNSAD